jgi:acetylornithine deacetylase/succinyl-diaminopimelate desuccinylase-like protein
MRRAQERPDWNRRLACRAIIRNTTTVNFGPGAPSGAHQPKESVEVTELVAPTKIMALAIRRWCS